MLVLSRKKNESIVINNDITIVVVEIRGDKVRWALKLLVKYPFIVAKFTMRFNAATRLTTPAPAPLKIRTDRRCVGKRVGL